MNPSLRGTPLDREKRFIAPQPAGAMAAEEEPSLDLDLSPEEFQRLGHRVVDAIADYYRTIRTRPVFPGRTGEQVEAVFDEPLPLRGEAPEAVLDAWRDRILPNATHLGSPRYFGFVNGSGTMMGVLADALAAAVNMNVGAWKPAPAATEIERRTVRWIAEMIGYSPDCGGLFVSGGTMANLTGILTALRNLAEYDTTPEGLQSPRRKGRYTLYMADHEGHSSVVRVADILNLGRDAVRRVPSHEDFTMDVEALERMLEEDAGRGDIPFCVVGQVGSINVGAVDPLKAIADVCEERGLWFHADGACGAVGAILPQKRDLYRGLERADSVTLDPHKWLFMNYEAACVLVREPERLHRAFSLTAPYLRGTLPTEYTGMDYHEWGPQMSRGFKALKVWMTLKHWGVEGYRRLLAQGVRAAEHLDRRVREAEDFQALHEPVLFIYSFRYAPRDLQRRLEADPRRQRRVDRYLDRLNQRIADELQLSGLAFVMTTAVRDRTVLRLSICSHRTTLEEIDRVFEKMRELGHAVDKEERPPL